MKEAVTKVIDTLTQEDVHGAFQKLLERYNKCIAAGGGDNAPVYNSTLVTDYLTKMGIKTVRHPPYSPDLAPCDFCRYETIVEMKEAVTKVIDTLTQEDFHGAFQKLLERYNKCITAGGDYFEGD